MAANRLNTGASYKTLACFYFVTHEQPAAAFTLWSQKQVEKKTRVKWSLFFFLFFFLVRNLSQNRTVVLHVQTHNEVRKVLWSLDCCVSKANCLFLVSLFWCGSYSPCIFCKWTIFCKHYARDDRCPAPSRYSCFVHMYLVARWFRSLLLFSTLIVGPLLG